MQTRQTSTTLSHINSVVSSMKKEIPWDVDDDKLLNGDVEATWRREA
jgi:hypothetical protein